MEKPWEICLTRNGSLDCRLKAAVFYGGKSGKLLAYKSVDLDDNSTAILKCAEPLHTFTLNTPRYVGMAFVPDRGEIYLTGGLADIDNVWISSIITETVGKFNII